MLQSPNDTGFRRRLFVVLSFALLVHVWSLFSHLVAWDGWCYYELLKAHDFPPIAANAIASGVPTGIAVYRIISYFPDQVLAGKLASLLFDLVATWAFFYLLSTHRIVSRNAALVAAALFSLHSNVLVYVGLGMFNYEAALAAFGLAMVLHYWAMLTEHTLPRVILLITTVVLFFFALYIASLLVFFAVFVLSAYRLRYGSTRVTREQLLRFVLEDWYLLLLPPLAFLTRPATQGIYAGENHIALSKYWVIGYPGAVLHNVLPTLALPFRYLSFEPLLLVLLFALWLVTWLLLRWAWTSDEPRFPFARVFWICLVMFVCGVFPFLAVAKVPGMNDWDSRFAMLIPPAQSLFLAAAVAWLAWRMPAKAQQALFAGVLALYGMAAIENYRRWDVDWMKQQSAIQQLRHMPEVRAASVVEIDDQAHSLDNHARRYRFYEYNGWFVEAFGDQSRLGVGSGQPLAIVPEGMPRRSFLLSQYTPRDGGRVVVTIRLGQADSLHLPDYLRLKKAELFGNEPDWARDVVTLSTKPQ